MRVKRKEKVLKMIINPEKYENIGLSMQAAIQQLHDDILDVLIVYEEKVEKETYVVFLFIFI